jgi:hypothetical protein
MMMNLPSKTFVDIGKILGIKHLTEENYDNVIKLWDKEKEFNSIIKFIDKSGHKKIYNFMNKMKKIMTEHLSKQSYYMNIDVKEYKEKKCMLYESIGYKKSKYCYIDKNIGNKYLSLDITSANFQALKHISDGSITCNTWAEYLKQIIRNDVRSKDNSITEIPDIIYNSKFLRVFILSDLKDLQHVFESINLQMVKYILDNYHLDEQMCINGDEIIIKVKDYNEANDIVNKVSDFKYFKMFRARKFEICRIDVPYRDKNYVYHLYEDGTKRSLNIRPDHTNMIAEYMKTI